MCIFLTRHFKCVVDGARTKVARTRHTHQYLVRCANNTYGYCIADGALYSETEEYDIPCHTCTGKFMHPPVRAKAFSETVRHMPEENAAAREAAEDYLHCFCRFMMMAWLEKDCQLGVAQSYIYTVTKMETACRFNKHHLENGPFCDCSEVNEQPELHNISAAMRQVVARWYLLPNEHKDLFRYPEMRVNDQNGDPLDLRRVQLSWNDLHPQVTAQLCAEMRRRFSNQPDLSVLDRLRTPTTIGQIQVIPFMVETSDFDSRMEALSTISEKGFKDHSGLHLVSQWLLAFAAEIDRKRQATNTPKPANEPPDHEIAVSEWHVRSTLSRLALRCLANDSGLPLERARSVAYNLCAIYRPNEDDLWANGVPGILLYLLSFSKHFLLGRLGDSRVGGEILIHSAREELTQHYLLRNRQLRIDDEHARAAAVQSSVTPLTREEIIALPPDQMDCIVCEEALGYPLESHAAMRLKCKVGHLVGMKCWMGTWRPKSLQRLPDEEGIICHSCDRFKIGDWKAPFNRRPVFAQKIFEEEPVHGQDLP